jgi:hypothetical protein
MSQLTGFSWLVKARTVLNGCHAHRGKDYSDSRRNRSVTSSVPGAGKGRGRTLGRQSSRIFQLAKGERNWKSQREHILSPAKAGRRSNDYYVAGNWLARR